MGIIGRIVPPTLHHFVKRYFMAVSTQKKNPFWFCVLWQPVQHLTFSLSLCSCFVWASSPAAGALVANLLGGGAHAAPLGAGVEAGGQIGGDLDVLDLQLDGGTLKVGTHLAANVLHGHVHKSFVYTSLPATKNGKEKRKEDKSEKRGQTSKGQTKQKEKKTNEENEDGNKKQGEIKLARMSETGAAWPRMHNKSSIANSSASAHTRNPARGCIPVSLTGRSQATCAHLLSSPFLFTHQQQHTRRSGC